MLIKFLEFISENSLSDRIAALSARSTEKAKELASYAKVKKPYIPEPKDKEGERPSRPGILQNWHDKREAEKRGVDTSKWQDRYIVVPDKKPKDELDNIGKKPKKITVAGMGRKKAKEIVSDRVRAGGHLHIGGTRLVDPTHDESYQSTETEWDRKIHRPWFQNKFWGPAGPKNPKAKPKTLRTHRTGK